MSSFRYRRNSPLAKAALSAAVVVGLAGSATAQEISLPDAGGLPQASPGQTIAPPPAAVALPEGATIDGSREKIQTIAREAEKSLEDLIGSSVIPRTEAEVGEMAARKRRIMMLEDQLKEARLAKELWLELHGEQEENSDELKRLEEENAELEAKLEQLRTAPVSLSSEPDPVVAEIVGSSGKLQARILVPFAGEIRASAGTVLPNGMTVSSISGSGVRVTKDGTTKILPFGTSVPKYRTDAASAGAN